MYLKNEACINDRLLGPAFELIAAFADEFVGTANDCDFGAALVEKRSGCKFIVDITPVWEEKKRAVLAHGSQVGRGAKSVSTPLNDPDFMERIEARARHFGSQIGVRYGEPFRSTEPIGFRSLAALIGSARPEPGSFTG